MKTERFVIRGLLAAALLLGASVHSDAKKPRELWLGADISGTTHDEARGSGYMARKEKKE